MTGLALLPDWTLASVSHDRTIRLWDLHTFRLLKTVKDAHETPLQGIDYSPHREEFVTWAMDNFAYVWDAVTLSTKYALVGHSAEVTQVSHCHATLVGICSIAWPTCACHADGFWPIGSATVCVFTVRSWRFA